MYFYVKFNGFVVNYSAYSTYSCIRYYEFLSWQNYWGGGKTICLPPPPPPNIFHWGGGGAAPPRIDASACRGVVGADCRVTSFSRRVINSMAFFDNNT